MDEALSLCNEKSQKLIRKDTAEYYRNRSRCLIFRTIVTVTNDGDADVLSNVIEQSCYDAVLTHCNTSIRAPFRNWNCREFVAYTVFDLV